MDAEVWWGWRWRASLCELGRTWAASLCELVRRCAHHLLDQAGTEGLHAILLDQKHEARLLAVSARALVPEDTQKGRGEVKGGLLGGRDPHVDGDRVRHALDRHVAARRRRREGSERSEGGERKDL